MVGRRWGDCGEQWLCPVLHSLGGPGTTLVVRRRWRLGDVLGTANSEVVTAPVESFRLIFTVTARLGEAALSVVTVLSLDGSDCEAALASTSETADRAAAGTGPTSDESSTASRRQHRDRKSVV